jgi:hypothetical protein
VPARKNLGNGCFPPVEWAAWDIPPNGWAGGSEKISRGLFANKKSFFIREEAPEAGIPPGHWAEGHPPGHWAGCAIFVISSLNLYFTNYLELKLFPNTRFIRHTLMYAYKILIQFFEEDYGI